MAILIEREEYTRLKAAEQQLFQLQEERDEFVERLATLEAEMVQARGVLARVIPSLGHASILVAMPEPVRDQAGVLVKEIRAALGQH